jgi:hypothetical protein
MLYVCLYGKKKKPAIFPRQATGGGVELFDFVLGASGGRDLDGYACVAYPGEHV